MEQSNSDGTKWVVEQWNSGTVILEQCCGTVMVEQCGGIIE